MNTETSKRRAAITAEIVERTGIDDDMIERLVLAFYQKVRRDPLLGRIFEERVEDWSHHLEQMCAFWSSVALMSGVYHGQPMAKHLRLPVDGRHFDRWLALFEETARRICPPAASDHFIQRARSIAQSLETGIAGNLGVAFGGGRRLRRSDQDVVLPKGGAPDSDEGEPERRLASSPCSMPEIDVS